MEHKNLWVCDRCLMAIESHEGKQATFTHYIDEDDEIPCDWCGETMFDTLYELI